MIKRLREILVRLLTTRVAWPIVLTMSLLCTASLLALELSSPERAERQEIFILIGVGTVLLTMLPNFQSIGRVAYVFFGVTIVLLIAVLFTKEFKNVHRWFILPMDLKFQPSEPAKIAFVLAVAWYLRYRRNLHTLLGLLVPFLLMIVPFLLILKEPDLGTALLFPLTLYAMLIAAGARLRHLLTIALVVILAAPGAFPFLKEYQQERIRTMVRNWVDPAGEQDAAPGKKLTNVSDNQRQQLWSMAVIGAGGITGQGQKGVQYIGRLSESYTDFIFAVIGVQWGFVGCVMVLVFYLAFLAATIEIAASTKDHFGRVMVVGLSSMILFQALINIAMTIALAPVVGVALPFVSYGGSSLTTSMLAAGLLLNVSVRRQKHTAAALQYATV